MALATVVVGAEPWLAPKRLVRVVRRKYQKNRAKEATFELRSEMSEKSTPALSRDQWNSLRERLQLDTSGDCFDRLVSHYNEPHRAYHNARHINDCLKQLDLAPTSTLNTDVVELALWFHDVIYDVRANDNERASAKFAVEFLSTCSASTELIDQTVRLILATEHQAIPVDAESQLMIDIDLSILGSPPERYDEFEEQIRTEYAWVPEDVFRAKRPEILLGFLKRQQLFSTTSFRERYEEQARSNLENAINQLTQNLREA